MDELQTNTPKQVSEPAQVKEPQSASYIDLSDPDLQYVPTVAKSNTPTKASEAESATPATNDANQDAEKTHELELNRQNSERLRKESNKAKALANLKALGVDDKTLNSMNKSTDKTDSPNNDVDAKYTKLASKKGARRELTNVTEKTVKHDKTVNSSVDKSLRQRAMQKVRETTQAAKKAADKFARMEGVRPQSTRTMSGTHKELYMASLIRRENKRTGRQFWSAHIKQRADVDMHNPFAGSDLADYKLSGRPTHYHNQTLSDATVDKIMAVNGRPPITPEQKQSSLQNKTSLISYSTAVPFTGNVFEESRRPGSFIVNQNTVDKPTVPMDPKKEAAAELYIEHHPELKIEHQESLKLENKRSPEMQKMDDKFAQDLANEFKQRRLQTDVANLRRQDQLGISNDSGNSGVKSYEPEVGDDGEEFEL